MKKLIRKILKEQEEDKPPIPIWNYEKRYKDVYNYLDDEFKKLEKRKAKFYTGIILAFPEEEYGILGYRNNGLLYIYNGLINEISSTFGLDKSDSKSIIGRWVSDRYQLEVTNITPASTRLNWLAIDEEILNEQEEEDDKPPIPIYKKGYYRGGSFFNFLNTLLGNLIERRPKYYGGLVFTVDKKGNYGLDDGIIGFNSDDHSLYVHASILNNLENRFNLDSEDKSKLFFKEWFEDKFQLKIPKISDVIIFYNYIPIDYSEEIFDYLNSNYLNVLENHRKSKYFEGIIFEDPNTVVFPNRFDPLDRASQGDTTGYHAYDKEYGILGYIGDGTLSIYHELVDTLIQKFDLRNVIESEGIIGVWFNNTTDLPVNSTKTVYNHNRGYLAIDEEILNEQEENKPPIPIWNYEKKYKDVYNYLDTNLNGLVKRKVRHFNGIVFVYPQQEEYGILGYENDGTLYINILLIDEISSTFGLDKSDSKSIIGRWVSDRYQLKVTNTRASIACRT